MRWPVHHPTLGLPSPTLGELRASSDAGAGALWDAAVALAAWREQQQRELVERLAVLGEVPSSLPPQPLPTVQPGVGPDDLARAVVALRPDLLEILSGPLLDGARARWRERIGPSAALPLAQTWARRWCWLRGGRAGPVDVDLLLRSLPERTLWALAALHPRYNEELVTLREAYCALCDHLALAGRVGGTVAPAWLARQGDERLEVALDDGPGLVLLGEPGSGRRSVLERLRTWLCHRGVNVDNAHGGGFPDPRYRARPASVPAAIGPDRICAWTRPDREDPELVRYAAEMALDAAARFRLVLVATDAQRRALLGEVPALGQWPVISLSLPDDGELLPLWLCQRPYLEDLLGEPFDLAHLLARLAPDALRPALAALDPHDRYVPERGHHARVGGLFAPHRPPLTALSVRSPERAHRRLLAQRPALAPLVPQPERLVELLELDAALSG